MVRWVAGYWGVDWGCIGIGERGRGRFIRDLSPDGLKGGWEKVDGLGSESANSSRVSISELLNCEMVTKTVYVEVLSESMLGELLVYDG